MQVLNVGLIKNPINWLVILLMVVIGATGGHLLLSYFGVEPATEKS